MASEDVEYEANEDQTVNLFGSLLGSIAIHHLSNSNKRGTRQGSRTLLHATLQPDMSHEQDHKYSLPQLQWMCLLLYHGDDC